MLTAKECDWAITATLRTAVTTIQYYDCDRNDNEPNVIGSEIRCCDSLLFCRVMQDQAKLWLATSWLLETGKPGATASELALNQNGGIMHDRIIRRLPTAVVNWFPLVTADVFWAKTTQFYLATDVGLFISQSLTFEGHNSIQNHILNLICPRPANTRIVRIVPMLDNRTVPHIRQDKLPSGNKTRRIYAVLTAVELKAIQHQRQKCWFVFAARFSHSDWRGEVNCNAHARPKNFRAKTSTPPAQRSAHTRGYVAGTCRGEEFHALFTRRGMLRG